MVRGPRAALSIVDHERPYRTARIRGRVVATREGAAALDVMDAMSQRYTGADFPMRSGVLYEVEVEHDSFTELPFRH